VKDMATHWDSVFKTKESDEVSWFQAEPVTCERLLLQWAPPVCSVIDIGAGTSTLVSELLDAGYEDVTLLDRRPLCRLTTLQVARRPTRRFVLLETGPPRQCDVLRPAVEPVHAVISSRAPWAAKA